MNIKDYTIIARGIARSVPGSISDRARRMEEREILVMRLADELAAEDSNFDRTWFVRACGCDCS
jgi:hypothetical protein